MAKKELNKDIEDLKKNVKDKNVTIGTDRVVKALQIGTLEKVYVASNCPTGVYEDIGHLTKVADIPLIQIELNNEELGVLCKKNFFIAVIGVNGTSKT